MLNRALFRVGMQAGIEGEKFSGAEYTLITVGTAATLHLLL
jgi:hypothetical protein